MTTEKNIKTTKAPYRMTRVTRTPNPKYVPRSLNSRTRYPDIETTTHTFFETLEAAVAYQAANGGTIEALSATGKSYQRLK